MNNLYSVYVCVYYGQASVEEQAAYWACPRSQYILIISLFFFLIKKHYSNVPCLSWTEDMLLRKHTENPLGCSCEHPPRYCTVSGAQKEISSWGDFWFAPQRHAVKVRDIHPLLNASQMFL